jgi:hypothetical protein
VKGESFNKNMNILTKLKKEGAAGVGGQSDWARAGRRKQA